MLNTNLSFIDYLVFSILLIISSLIGVFFWFKSRNSNSNEEFLRGNRRLAVFPVTMSLVASFMSSNTLLGVPAEVYLLGTQFSLQIISLTIAVVLAAEVFMPIYYRLGLLSVNEYLMKRFDSEYLRLAGSIGFLLTMTPYMAVMLYGPALALSSVTPLSVSTSILGVGSICTFYTSIVSHLLNNPEGCAGVGAYLSLDWKIVYLSHPIPTTNELQIISLIFGFKGGIKAVIWTDVLQCILMFFGALMVIIQGALEVGGLTEVWRVNKEGGRLKFFNMNVDLYNHDNFWNVVVGSAVTWSACYCITQIQVQRYCSLESAKKAKRALYWNLPALLLLVIMSVICGMVIYAKYHDCDPVTLGLIERHDQLMPYYVMDTLSKFPGLPGLFIASVFSGSLSTLSSGFNALAAITWEDLIKPRINLKNEKYALTVTKLIAMSYGLLAIAMSFCIGNTGTVLQASNAFVGSMIGPLFALFVLGVLYPYATAPGSLIGFISGVTVGLIISIGSLVNPRPKVSLPTTLDSCPNDVLLDVYSRFSGKPTSQFIESYDNPEGFNKLFHISYLILSVIGFIICLIVGAILSLCIGHRKETMDSHLMTPLARYIFPWVKFDEISSAEKWKWKDMKEIGLQL